MKVIFVGGPRDGQLIECDNDLTHIAAECEDGSRVIYKIALSLEATTVAQLTSDSRFPIAALAEAYCITSAAWEALAQDRGI